MHFREHTGNFALATHARGRVNVAPQTGQVSVSVQPNGRDDCRAFGRDARGFAERPRLAFADDAPVVGREELIDSGAANANHVAAERHDVDALDGLPSDGAGGEVKGEGEARIVHLIMPRPSNVGEDLRIVG